MIYDGELDTSAGPEVKRKLQGNRYRDNDLFKECRTNPLLVRVVEELGPKANGPLANFRVFEIQIPDDAYAQIRNSRDNGSETPVFISLRVSFGPCCAST